MEDNTVWPFEMKSYSLYDTLFQIIILKMEF